MATEAPAVSREAMIRELRRRLRLDLAWDAATDVELAAMLADLDGADDRFADWEPTTERRAEAR